MSTFSDASETVMKKTAIAGLSIAYLAVLVSRFFYHQQLVLSGPAPVRVFLELAAAVLIMASALGAGRLLFRLILKAAPADGMEKLSALGLGFLSLALLAFLLNAFRILHHWIVFAGISIFFIPALCHLRNMEIRTASRDKLFSADLLPLLVLIAGFLGCLLVSALAPPRSWDEQVYHLLLPKLYLKHHGFCQVPLIYSGFPQNQEMLYTLAMGIGDTVSAHLVHFSCGILTLMLIFHLGMKFFGSSRAGLWAVILFAFSGTFSFEAATAYLELGLTFLSLLALTAAVKFLDSQSARWLVICAMFAGGALATKYTAAGALIATGILVLAWAGKRRLTMTMLYLAIALLFLLPWLTKNLILTSNPFFPFLTELLDGPGWNLSLHRRYVHSLMLEGMGRQWYDYLLLFPRLFIHGRLDSLLFDARYNILLLLLSPAFPLFVRDRRSGWLWLWFALVFAAWAAGPQHGRFLLPGIAVLAILCGAAFDRMLKRLPRWGVAPASVLALALSLTWMPTGFLELRSELRFLAGKTSTEAYLLENRNWKGLVRINELLAINSMVPKDSRVFMLWENRGLYLEPEYLADSAFEASYTKQLIAQMGSAGRLYTWLKANNFAYIYNAWLGPWDADLLMTAETREEYGRAERIYRELTSQYVELVFRKDGELVRLKPD